MWLRMLATIAVLAFLGALLYAAYHDVTTYRIPNWLSVAIVADFLFAAAAGEQRLAGEAPRSITRGAPRFEPRRDENTPNTPVHPPPSGSGRNRGPNPASPDFMCRFGATRHA